MLAIIKIGTNPFLLLREHPDFMNLPFVQNPNYLEKLDGRGLNPLLMNYWMTIHPPTLFLGFASTLVPFAFAIAAFWNKNMTPGKKRLYRGHSSVF
jgi:cytochrome c-type biogenesis protein CcmF